MAKTPAENLFEAITRRRDDLPTANITYRIPQRETIAAMPLISDQLRESIRKGWAATWSFLFDDPRRPLVSRLARHHRDSIKWHWITRHRMCRRTVEIQNLSTQLASGAITEAEFSMLNAACEAHHRIRYYADFPMWSRGHAKSTIARRVAVVDAIISMYYGVGGYCLYFSGTDKKTDLHAKSIEKLLRSHRVREHAPLLAQVNRSEEGGRSLGWKATMFYTAAGYVYHFGSLQTGLAGGNLEDLRVTMMIPDDIDDRSDSPVEAENNFNKLTLEILPMGQKGTLTFWAQNPIHRLSCMYRIYKGHARVLTNRRPTDPVPAFVPETFRCEVQTVDGNVQDVIQPGAIPTWPWFGIEAAQEELNRMGLPAFLRECMHDLEGALEGLIARNYDDAVHPISESEFALAFGSSRAYQTWNKWIFHDYARTKTKFHANVAGYITVSSQNTFYPGFTFIIHPMSFPPNTGGEDVAERLLSVLEQRTIEHDGKEGETWAELRRDTLLRRNVPEHLTARRDQLAFELDVLSEIIPKYSEPVLRRWNVRGGVMSHSEDTLRELYRRAYGIVLSASNPGMFDGVEEINRAMQVDYTVPHAFRPSVNGYTRWAIVVPDDETKQPTEVELVNSRGVKRRGLVYPPIPYPHALKPDDLHDHDLIRYQLSNWRTAPPQLSKTGEKIDIIEKLNDDFGQCLQMFYFKKPLENVPLSVPELVEEHMPAGLTLPVLEMTETPEVRAALLQGRLKKLDEIRRELARPAVHPGIARIKRR